MPRIVALGNIVIVIVVITVIVIVLLLLLLVAKKEIGWKFRNQFRCFELVFMISGVDVLLAHCRGLFLPSPRLARSSDEREIVRILLRNNMTGSCERRRYDVASTH